MQGDSSTWNWEKINKYIPPNWISQLMEQAQSMELNIKLPIKDDKKWDNDKTIMDMFTQKAVPNLRMINEIPLFLKVTWISDILDIDSGKKSTHAWRCKPNYSIQ